jgi:two-component system NtrC family sensor kinase
MFRTRFGLQSKIIIIFSLAVISVVGVSTFIAMWLTRDPVEEEIYRKTLAQARLTARQLGQEQILRNPASLLSALEQVRHDLPGTSQADVYLHSPEHTLLSTTDPAGEHLELDHLPDVEKYPAYWQPGQGQVTIETPGGRYWIMSTAILEQGEPVGCLILKVSKSRSNVVTRELVERNLLLMLASLAVVILVIHVFILRHVRNPVKEMVRVMEAAEGGQLDVQAKVASGDEIGQLAGHLNRMLARIANFNTELGRKVEEATAESARRNEELRRINEELFETQKNLARLERLAVAGQLAASLAHEIGTPLNSMSGHVQLLARRSTQDEGTRRRLQIIEKQIENIVRTVKQLLSWTHTIDLHLEPVNLRHTLEESVLISSAALRLRGIEVRTELPEDYPTIYADPGYLQQVFLNLINNSMDAMPKGGRLTLRLRYPVDGGGREVAVEVADTGQGMSAETLTRIFEPMFTTKRMGTGTGLGLAICDQIIRQHAGRIQVESEPGRGTRFTIILPVDCRGKLEAAGGPAAVMTSVE